MHRSVRDSRGAQRRWGPHFSYLNEVKVKQRWWGNSTYRLRYWNTKSILITVSGGVVCCNSTYLPFTVLKHTTATHACCVGYRGRNSTYRLQYAPQSVRQQRSKATMRAIHCLPERSEGKTKVIGQQCLPFTVLKQVRLTLSLIWWIKVRTTLIVYDIEATQHKGHLLVYLYCYNSPIVYGIETRILILGLLLQ